MSGSQSVPQEASSSLDPATQQRVLSSPTREAIRMARRVVVKIGSSSISHPDGGLDRDKLDKLATVLEERMSAGSDVFVVSSGAISAGITPLKLHKRPRDIATKQAAAAVGQVELAKAWGESFDRYGRTVAQVLLTASDLGKRDRARNAQNTLDRIRLLHGVPIINENDTVATDEIRFGDNDRLAALVAHLVSADALVLLSDVDGLYDSDPRQGNATFIPEVAHPAVIDGVEAGDGGALGTGGMASKLSSALLAADAGVPVLLAASHEADAALRDASVGTVFAARPKRMTAKKFWVRYSADNAGTLIVDEGAAAAVRRRRSLLAAGVVTGEGDFHGGDVVEVRTRAGELVGRGIVSYAAGEMEFMYRMSTDELPKDMHAPVIHADDLVLA